MTNRKLQGEIDRVLKKVTEGTELFEDTCEKLYATTNPSQKEKFEQELKKEIKKLQRLRDQIKSWISNGDIKDKSALIDNRKLIESLMEKFKGIEKEMKTKQYSKEGLMAKERLDPAEIAKQEMSSWITSAVERLTTQVDSLEAEAESLKAPTRSRKGGSSSAKKNTERMREIDESLEQHKFHMTKLETILRLLQNDSLSVDDVETIKESVEFYIEANQDPDFIDDDGLYDHLDLLDEEVFGALEDHHASAESIESSGSASNLFEALAEAEKAKLGLEQKKDPASASSSNESNTTATDTLKKSANSSRPSSAPPQQSSGGDGSKVHTPSSISTSTSTGSSSSGNNNSSSNQAVQAMSSTISGNKPSMDDDGTLGKPSKDSISPVSSTMPQIPFSKMVSAAKSASTQNQMQDQLAAATAGLALDSSTQTSNLHSMNAAKTRSSQFNPRFPSSFQDLIATFNAAKSKTYGRGDEVLRNQHLLQLLHSGFYQCPDSAIDSKFVPSLDKKGRKKISSLESLPDSFADIYKSGSPIQPTPQIFHSLPLDTLFTAFYYLPDTKYQLLASQALKNQSWRFHKVHKRWFQRFEEPTEIGDEYEKGAYLFFDYSPDSSIEGAAPVDPERFGANHESSKFWCQKKKLDFKFEYKHLEDE